MKIDFPYPGYEQIQPVNVPNENLMGVFSPRAFDSVDEKKVLADGFAKAIGAPRLRDASSNREPGSSDPAHLVGAEPSRYRAGPTGARVRARGADQ